MGQKHGGVDFLKGPLPRIKGYVIRVITMSRCGKIYIDDSNWGPKDGSIEYVYQIPFGKIHICKIGASGPETDMCTDILEPARCKLIERVQTGRKHIFVGFTQGVQIADNSMTSGDTLVSHDGEPSNGKTELMCPLFDSRLGGGIDDWEFIDTPCQVVVYMAGTVVVHNFVVTRATNGAGGSASASGAVGASKTLAQALVDLMVEMSNLLASPVPPKN
ncbi:putative non-inhibitory serpin-10 [Hordeum vulgare]|nr:putative non-inhibitory serpin-10 [Hordeum vulgare]